MSDAITVTFGGQPLVVQYGENTTAAANSAGLAIIARRGSETAQSLSEAACDEAVAARDVAAAQQNYFATRADGAAATATNGIFTSDEEGSLRWYRRTASAPNYAFAGYADPRGFYAADTGAPAIGRKRSEASAILEPVQAILDRIDMSSASFGALAAEDGTDYVRLKAFTDAITASGEGIRQLDAKHYTVGASSATEGIDWDQSNGGLIGRGRLRTIVENVNGSASYAMKFVASCENAYFADMTFKGRVLPSGALSLKNIIFNRCGFTASALQTINALQFPAENLTGGGLQFLYLFDGVIYGAKRMGLEITNGTNDGVLRYGNISLIRPRFVGNTMQALSLSGKGEAAFVDGS